MPVTQLLLRRCLCATSAKRRKPQSIVLSAQRPSSPAMAATQPRTRLQRSKPTPPSRPKSIWRLALRTLLAVELLQRHHQCVESTQTKHSKSFATRATSSSAQCVAFSNTKRTTSLTPVDQAAGVHRETIEALPAEVVVTRQQAIVAATAVKIIRGHLEGNMKAALKVVNEGCNRLLRAVNQRRDELIALVNGAYHGKDDVYNKHKTALEAIDADSEAAVQLIEATLAVATPVELLEWKQLFVTGLTHFKQHSVALKETCAPNLTITLTQSTKAILALGALDTDATDPATSTAAGEGLAVAKVGEASEFVVTAVAVGSGEHRRFGGDKVEVTLVGFGAVDEGAAPSGGGSGESQKRRSAPTNTTAPAQITRHPARLFTTPYFMQYDKYMCIHHMHRVCCCFI